MNRKFLAVVPLALLLSSCAFQDNKANNQVTENARFVPCSQAYDGYEEYLGKDYKKFKLPEKISMTEIGNIYTLECNTQENQTDIDEIKNIYKKFYGDSYDEDMLITDPNGGLIYLAGENSSTYWGMDLALLTSDFQVLSTSFDTGPVLVQYITDVQGDESFSVDGKQYNVGEESRLIDEYIDDMLKNFYTGWDIRVKEIYTESFEGETRLYFSSCMMCENIPLQYEDSDYFVTDNDGSLTYWSAAQVRGETKDDEFIYVYAGVPYTILNKTKQEEIISFAEAVRILDEGIAENAGLEFVNAELMYCSLVTQPAFDYSPGADVEETDKLAREYHLQAKTFEPYWCFEIANDYSTKVKRYVKVNALTGELFMDMN